jgi:hypothetical protein
MCVTGAVVLLWMTWAFENQRSRETMEISIRRAMDYQISSKSRSIFCLSAELSVRDVLIS